MLPGAPLLRPARPEASTQSMSAFGLKRTLDRHPRQVAAPTALNFGVLKSISVTKTYGGSFEYLVSRIRNGVEHNDENDRENDRGNAGQYEWLHDDGPPFRQLHSSLFFFYFPTGLTRQLVSTIAKHSSPVFGSPRTRFSLTEYNRRAYGPDCSWATSNNHVRTKWIATLVAPRWSTYRLSGHSTDLSRSFSAEPAG